MPASKFVNVLAILRKRLSLKQGELAELAGCSISSIQAIEVNKLRLSESLAARISVSTGADLNWLLRNDVNEPMPPIKRLRADPPTDPGNADNVTTVVLWMIFDRLFAIARRAPKTEARRMLELNVGWQLDALKNSEGDPDADRFFDSPSWGSFYKSCSFDPELAKIINFKYLVEDDRKRQKLAKKEDREFDRKWKQTVKTIKATPADQLSEDEKAFLKADKEGKKFERELKAQLKAQIAKELAQMHYQPAETELPKRQKAPRRTRP